LEEEVRDLVVKADADELKFKDRAKFLWKEDTFKELLTQIRGQQSALSLLIQGLQMESIADIRKLVEENSVTLEEVVKRSRTLRQSHPRIRVPETLFDHREGIDDAVDAESIAKSAEFSFDNEVINSRAYRRAMTLYTSQNKNKEPHVSEHEIETEDLPAYESPPQSLEADVKRSATTDDSMSKPSSAETPAIEEELRKTQSVPTEGVFAHDPEDALDSIERSYLPYMPRITSTAPFLTPMQVNTIPAQTAQSTLPPLRIPVRSQSEGNLLSSVETAPPLPPRRPSGPQLRTEVNSADDVIGYDSSTVSTYISTSPSSFSKVSMASSRTLSESLDSRRMVVRKPVRKPLPVTHQASNDVPYTDRITPTPNTTSIPSRPPLQNAEMRSIWLSLIEAEQKFIERMTKFRKMFYDNVLRSWPVLEDHIQAIVVCGQLAAVNEDKLLQVMQSQISVDEESICNPSIFEQYTNTAHKTYREYLQKMPHAMSSLQTIQTMDSKFGPFVNTLGLSILWFGKGWEDYLRSPCAQLELYIRTIQGLMCIAKELGTSAGFKEVARLERAAEAVQWLKATSDGILEEAQKREDVQNLEKRIHTMDATIFSQLRMLDSNRRIKHQGAMAIKLKSQGPWLAVHVMLLDNYLLWGKIKTQKKFKGDKIMVLDAPISIGALKITTSCEKHLFQKATMLDELPRGTVVYTIGVKSGDVDAMKPHLLGAFGYQEHKVWLEHLTNAINTSGKTEG
jgi:hypothetical protein